MLSKNQIKLIKGLSLKKNRTQLKLFTVEGRKGIIEFLNSDFKCRSIYSTDPELFKREQVSVISESDLRRISQLKTPNKALAIFEIPKETIVDESGLIVALDDIKDPGNLGTIIRLCDWFGVTEIICSHQTVDCYNSKVVQASMGSLSRINIHYLNLEDYLRSYSNPIYGTYLKGVSIYQTHFTMQGILLMGNESNGISQSLEALVTNKITIPQYVKVIETESLNVATATAICLAEIKRSI
ncbi:TrmH family RNA methyltransferase [Winogradskyella aurantiaca]|uniref:TrmH family RNA methyltransferase n=1 Tax=Winogradskyella aurantiaca TaxID=2219558 RepID=UPI000E1C8AC5|nr:RNA methyltransferase [Winogradskyella aurantiaca]